MMHNRLIVFTETVVTSVAPKRAFEAAEECLIEIRVVESRKKAANWIYEYEVKGEIEKIEKFRERIESLKIFE